MLSESKPGRSRWFVQLYRDDVDKRVRKLGRVCKFGGTDSRTPYPWIELTTAACTQVEFQALIDEAGASELVRKVLPVERGKGATLARQLELFAW